LGAIGKYLKCGRAVRSPKRYR